eukprot:UN09447
MGVPVHRLVRQADGNLMTKSAQVTRSEPKKAFYGYTVVNSNNNPNNTYINDNNTEKSLGSLLHNRKIELESAHFKVLCLYQRLESEFDFFNNNNNIQNNNNIGNNNNNNLQQQSTMLYSRNGINPLHTIRRGASVRSE